MRRHLLIPAALVAISGLAPACGPAQQGAADSGARPADTAGPVNAGTVGAADTLRGIVAEVGADPVTATVLRPPGAAPVTITGPLAGEIARAAGADVWVSGRRSGNELAVASYAIRAVDGEPAVDGVLALAGDTLQLVTASGRIPVPRPPSALRGMIGARVWLVGPPGRNVTAYGVLREAGRRGR